MIEHLHRIAAHAWHVGEMEVGRRACEKLLAQPLSDRLEAIVRRNRTWYTSRLCDLMKVTYHRLTPPVGEWTAFNPSIVATADGWIVNVRSSNYRIVDGRYVIPPEDGETIRTRNVLCDLADDFTLTLAREIRCDYERTAYPVDGLEDVRLNVVGGELVASATTRNVAPHDGTCRISVGMVKDWDIPDLVCRETLDGVHEKNWMPILGRREWLYSCRAQDHVATVVEDGESWIVTTRAESPLRCRGFRGGSQLVPIGGGRWLAIIHEVAHDGNRRIYEHRFVTFREHEDWRIDAVSEPFAIRESRTIEFVAGLAVKSNRVAISFGVRDEEAWIAEAPLDVILASMEAV